VEISELVRKAGKGNAAAFEELMCRYQNKVYSMALRFSGSREEAADITQEVFLRIWRALPGFKGEAQFSTWLCRITHNICTDHYRKASRIDAVSLTRFGEEAEEGQIDLEDIDHDPERIMEQSDLTEALKRAVDSLRPEMRTVFVMREIADMSYMQMVEILGVEEGTVKSRLFRARKQLQKILRENGNIPNTVSSKKEKGGE